MHRHPSIQGTVSLTVILLFSLLVSSCGTSRSRISDDHIKAGPPETRINTAPREIAPKDERVFKIASFAREFEGTRYKYGGSTEKGMDCSGLVYTAFLKEDIRLPRSSRAMSLEGIRLPLVEVNIGDLLFFETDKNQKVINHVGLVVAIQPGHIHFIHSTTSRGVIISSLADKYWYEHFVMARRVI